MWELGVVFFAFVLTLCIFVYIVVRDISSKGGLRYPYGLNRSGEFVHTGVPTWGEQQISNPTLDDTSGPIEYIKVDQFVEMVKGAPHIAALGNTGSGKTTLGEALLRMLQGEHFFIIDPNWFPGKWAGAKAHTTGPGDDYKPIAEALELVWKEFSRRTGEHSTKEYPKFNVLWDEVNDCMEEIKDAGTKLRRWLRRGRHFGIRMILFPQSDRVEALGISRHGDALKNILWIYLGEHAKALIAKIKSNDSAFAIEADLLMSAKYLCILEYGGRYFCVDPNEIKRISEEPVNVNPALVFPEENGRVATEETEESAVKKQSGCGMDAYDAIIKIADSGLVKSEIALLETVFDCKAGSGKDYVEARTKLIERRSGNKKSQ